MYLKIVFGLTFLLVATVSAVNYCVDPVGIYGNNIGNPRPAATSYLRLHKREAVKRLKPDVVIIGTSRSDIGLDPKPEFFPGRRPYNMALSASLIHEQRLMLEFAQAVSPLKEAIIALDFIAFNARKLENKQFEPEKLSPEALSPLRSFFDTYGTIVSLDTLIAANKHRRYVRRLDRYSYPQPNGHKVNNGDVYDIAQNGVSHKFRLSPLSMAAMAEEFSFDYADGTSVFQQLAAMLEFCRARNIKATLLLSPVHETHLRQLEGAGKGELVKEWKRRVAEVVRADGARHGVKPYALWDFAYPNSLTREPVSEKGMKWFWDSGHYKAALGDIVLAKVLGLPAARKYPDFGRRL